MKADAAVQGAQDDVALLTARFDVRRTELDASGNEFIGAVDAQKNILSHEEARRRLAQLLEDVKSRAATNQASLAVVQEKRTKAQLRDAARPAGDRQPLNARAPRKRDTAGAVLRSAAPRIHKGDGGAGPQALDVIVGAPWKFAPRSTRTMRTMSRRASEPRSTSIRCPVSAPEGRGACGPCQPRLLGERAGSSNEPFSSKAQVGRAHLGGSPQRPRLRTCSQLVTRRSVKANPLPLSVAHSHAADSAWLVLAGTCCATTWRTLLIREFNSSLRRSPSIMIEPQHLDRVRPLRTGGGDEHVVGPGIVNPCTFSRMPPTACRPPNNLSALPRFGGLVVAHRASRCRQRVKILSRSPSTQTGRVHQTSRLWSAHVLSSGNAHGE